MYIPRFLSWQAGKSLRKHLSPLYCLFPAFSQLNQLPTGRWTRPKVGLDQLTFQDSDIEGFVTAFCSARSMDLALNIPRTGNTA